MEAGGSKDSYSSDFGVTILAEAAQPSLSQPTTKKRRGRPPGSKNKPRTPNTVSAPQPTQQPAPRHFILEIPRGYDVVQSIISFARSRALAALAVASASGLIANVVLQNGGAQSPVFLPGVHNLMSLSGHIISLPTGGYSWSFSATLADTSHQVIGGVVTASTVAAGLVVVVLSVCENPSASRFPLLSDNAAAGNQRDAHNSGAVMFPKPAANGFSSSCLPRTMAAGGVHPLVRPTQW